VPKRVLICDDSLMTRQLVSEALSEDGWEIVGEAADGREAVDLYKRLKPDAVTLDLVMSNVDGLTALDQMIAFDSQAQVVVVSSVSRPDVIAECLRKGAQDFIAKPFTNEQLQQAMANCVVNMPDTCPTS